MVYYTSSTIISITRNPPELNGIGNYSTPYITVTRSSGRLEWSLCTLCRADPRSLQVTRREPVATLRLEAAQGSGFRV